jgi:RHH-type rel operon transcriptional repressor/antitoxin RelB
MTTTISVSIPDELSKMLETFSQKEERSKSFYIKKALEDYFAKKLEDEEDYKDVVESLAEFKVSKEKGKSWEKLQKELKL